MAGSHYHAAVARVTFANQDTENSDPRTGTEAGGSTHASSGVADSTPGTTTGRSSIRACAKIGDDVEDKVEAHRRPEGAATPLLTRHVYSSPEKGKNDCGATPHRRAPKAANTLDLHTYSLTGVKRGRGCDDIFLRYETVSNHFFIKVHPGETMKSFYVRRDTTAALYAQRDSRITALCTWKSALVSLIVKDPKWVVVKNTPNEVCAECDGLIRLIKTRFGCGQSKSATGQKQVRCLGCESRSAHEGSCLRPTFLYHLIPIKTMSRGHVASYDDCNAAMANFQPIWLPEDPSFWMLNRPRQMSRQRTISF